MEDDDEPRRKFHDRRNSSTKSIDDQDNTFDCTICPSSFESQINLQRHLWSHLSRSERRYDDRKPTVQVNIQRGTSYSNSEIIFQSYGIDNSAEFNNSTGTFTCPICNKRISTKGNLKVHLETHRPKGKYGCDICGRM